MAAREATTMSVQEMGKLLGLKKTDSYYLLHKQCFETVVIAGKIRVVKASFESWYANQDWYKKVDGSEPGTELKKESLSISNIAIMLRLSKDRVFELVEKNHLPTFWIDNKLRVPRDAFDRWYASQTRYRNTEDHEKDKAAIDESMTVPEMGRLLGLDSREAWKLYTRFKGTLKLIRVAGRPRITKYSFQIWFGNQDEYQIVPVQKKKTTPRKKRLSKEYYTIPEAAAIVDMDERDLYRMVSRREIEGRKIGRQWFIEDKALQDILQNK